MVNGGTNFDGGLFCGRLNYVLASVRLLPHNQNQLHFAFNMNDSPQDLLSAPFIFLSYAKEDRERVEKVYRRLRKDALKPWLDLKHLQPGHRWDDVIRTTIRKCQFFAVFLSNYSVSKRGYIQREIKEALDVVDELPESSVFIIPIRLEQCEVPERLKPWQWVDIFENGGYNRLKASLINKLGSGYAPPPDKSQVSGGTTDTAFETAADSVLYEYFRQIKTFRYGLTHDRRHIMSDGTFMIIRETMPSGFKRLLSIVEDVAVLTDEQIREVVPEPESYKHPHNLVRKYTRRPGGLLELSTHNQQIECVVDPTRWRFVDLYFQDEDVYITSEYESVIVESNQKPAFVITPTWLQDTDFGDEGDYSPDALGDDDFFAGVPFDLR